MPPASPLQSLVSVLDSHGRLGHSGTARESVQKAFNSEHMSMLNNAFIIKTEHNVVLHSLFYIFIYIYI